MNRQALLLYLQNIRDLEMVIYMIKTNKEALSNYYHGKMAWIQTTPRYVNIPEHKNETINYFKLGFIGFLGICFIWFVGDLPINGIFDYYKSTVSNTYPGFISFLKIIVFFVWAGFVVREIIRVIDYNDTSEKKLQEAIKYNKNQDDVAKSGMAQYSKLYQEWERKKIDLEQELQQPTEILQQFYSMNIIPKQYRNKLASIVYIYDYMSSSQATFEETLRAAQIEQGIQRLEAMLDQVVDQLKREVEETRCIRNDNREYAEQIIDHNSRMLQHLQSVASSAQEAAQYSELSANYSKANAYFSFANYLSKYDL